jgi:hypothetical protein
MYILAPARTYTHTSAKTHIDIQYMFDARRMTPDQHNSQGLRPAEHLRQAVCGRTLPLTWGLPCPALPCKESNSPRHVTWQAAWQLPALLFIACERQPAQAACLQLCRGLRTGLEPQLRGRNNPGVVGPTVFPGLADAQKRQKPP